MRSRFDLFERRPVRTFRSVLLLTAILIASGPITGSGAVRPVVGRSGDLYLVRSEKEVWRSVGPALAVRFHTSGDNRSAAAAEAFDLLAHFGARADSARLRYLVLRADRPIWHAGDVGLYRAWNFRFERAEDGWTASDYW
jgi:hypothetical protein